MSKKVVITGASNGLGKEIASELISRGYMVFNIDKEEPGVESEPIYFKADTRDKKAIEECAKEIEKDLGGVDIVINNASINHLSYLKDLEKEDMEEVIETNVIGYYVVAKAFLPQLQCSEGTLVNIVSRSATQPMTASLPYNASKGAQLIMTKQMARELTKEDNITVFSVSPNRLKGTKMTQYIDEKVPEVRGWTKEYARKYQKKNSLVKEETDPRLIAKRLADILDDKHNFISGCDLKFGK